VLHPSQHHRDGWDASRRRATLRSRHKTGWPILYGLIVKGGLSRESAITLLPPIRDNLHTGRARLQSAINSRAEGASALPEGRSEGEPNDSLLSPPSPQTRRAKVHVCLKNAAPACPEITPSNYLIPNPAKLSSKSIPKNASKTTCQAPKPPNPMIHHNIGLAIYPPRTAIIKEGTRKNAQPGEAMHRGIKRPSPDLSHLFRRLCIFNMWRNYWGSNGRNQEKCAARGEATHRGIKKTESRPKSPVSKILSF
jgi:hypothetical protein